MRRRPKDDSDLAERINAYVRDPIADRFDRAYTDAEISKIEARRTRFWRDMRKKTQ